MSFTLGNLQSDAFQRYGVGICAILTSVIVSTVAVVVVVVSGPRAERTLKVAQQRVRN
jgi:hypothetical protein